MGQQTLDNGVVLLQQETIYSIPASTLLAALNIAPGSVVRVSMSKPVTALDKILAVFGACVPQINITVTRKCLLPSSAPATPVTPAEADSAETDDQDDGETVQ